MGVRLTISGRYRVVQKLWDKSENENYLLNSERSLSSKLSGLFIQDESIPQNISFTIFVYQLVKR